MVSETHKIRTDCAFSLRGASTPQAFFSHPDIPPTHNMIKKALGNEAISCTVTWKAVSWLSKQFPTTSARLPVQAGENSIYYSALQVLKV